MAYLKYDTDKIESTKLTYANCVEEMTNIETQMQNMVDEVKKAWQSEGGDAFFAKYSDEWLKGFTQYKEVLQHMSDNLQSAGESYTELTEKANELKIK